MAGEATLEQGRASYARRAWGDAYVQLSAADGEAPLPAEDLERLAYAAYLIGKDRDCEDALTRAHRAFLTRGDRESAARCAFWLAFALMNAGDVAPGSGW